MGHVLGIEIGAGSTRTAVCRRAADRPVWEPADPTAPAGPGAGGLLELVGDDVPVLAGDRLAAPHDVVADGVRAAVDADWAAEQEYPEAIAVAHPTGWGAGRIDLLRSALEDAGAGDVALVARACAITERFRAARLLPEPGLPVAVCRIGAAGVEASLAVPHEPGRLEMLGTAELDEVGGDDLAGCGPAEARGIAEAVVDLLRSAARSCELALTDLTAVLLAGSGAEHPVLADVLAAAAGAPVLRDDDPLATVACGAALVMRPPAPSAGAPPGFEESATVAISTARVVAAVGAMPPRPPLHVSAPPAGRR